MADSSKGEIKSKVKGEIKSKVKGEIDVDMLSGEWLMKEIRNIMNKKPKEQDRIFAKFFRKYVKPPFLNKELCKKGSWPGATITNYHIDLVPEVSRMYLVTDGRETISNYYNVSPDKDLINLVPYLPLIRLEEECEIHSVPREKDYFFKIIKPGKTELLDNIKIALFPLLDRHIFPADNLTRAKFLIPNECSFTFRGLPYPIFAMPDEIKRHYL